MNIEEAILAIGPAIKERRCIPFCGAGISVESGLPTASQLLKARNMEQHAWGEAMRLMTHIEPGFSMDLLKRFGRVSLKPNDQHRYIAMLDAPFTITTNYDLLLEKAFSQVRCGEENRLGIVRCSRHLPRVANHPNVLIKLHGDASDDDGTQELFVLTNEQYSDRLTRHNPVDDYVRGLFLTYSILFIGYSLSDQEIDVRKILRDCACCNSPYLPERYIAITDDYNQEMDTSLKTLGVRPIYLKVNDGNRHLAITEFLHRLWERRPGHAEFVWLHSRGGGNLEETLTTALAFKERGRLEEAWDLLSSIEKRNVNWAAQGTLAETFLYLGVAVRDKLERWSELKAFRDHTASKILEQLKELSPPLAYHFTVSIYHGHMALAMLRCGDFEAAANNVKQALKHKPTTTADAELWLQYANFLVTHAMTLLSLWAEKPGDAAWLESAKLELDSAEDIFKRFEGDERTNEPHYMGRFHGTRAFLMLAQQKNGVNVNAAVMLNHAIQAHTGSQRTSFGRTAGMYCEAFCRYCLSRLQHPSSESEVLRLKARELTQNALKFLDSNGNRMPRLKLRILARQLDPKADADESNYEAIFETSEVISLMVENPMLQSLIRKPEWLYTPLN